MISIRSLPHYEELIKGVLRKSEDIGNLVPSEVAQHCLTSFEVNKRGVRHDTDPLTALLLWISKSFSFLTREIWIHSHVKKTFLALYWQQSPGSGERLSSRWLETASLLARRQIVGLAFRIEEISLLEEYADYRRGLYLPKPNWKLGELSREPASFEYIERFYLWANRFSQLLPLDERIAPIKAKSEDFEGAAADSFETIYYRESPQGLDAPKRRKGISNLRAEEIAANTALANTTSLEVPAYMHLRAVQRKSAKIQTEDLIFLLELFHGVDYRNAGDLGLSQSTIYGRLTTSHLWIEVGSPYFGCGEQCYARSTLKLPLAREIQARLEFLGEEFFSHSNLATAVGGWAYAKQYKDWVETTSCKYVPKDAVGGSSFAHVWQKVALIDVEIPTPLIGILQAHPLPSDRGPSSYAGAKDDELLPAQSAIHDRLRVKAGI